VVSPSRAAAFDILMLVGQGGYAVDLLASRTAALDPRDAGLASEIVLGSLRYQAQLDFLIESLAKRPAARLDPEVRTALRMGIYQIRYLTRVPPHAAVGESVELVKRARKRSAAPLVNAVLRKTHRDPVTWPDRATELSIPAWLLDRWDRHYGPDTATVIARAALTPPETYVRISEASQKEPGTLRASSDADRKLSASQACPRDFLAPTDVPGAFRLPVGQALPPASNLRIQDIGAQSIVPLLDLSPGQSYLDLCAAPGNKTAQALESGVRAVACDIHWSRLAPMKSLGCPLVVLDAAAPLPFARTFDRILVDAPCTGTGTLARNPEIKWRLRPDDIDRLHAYQVRLLRNALAALAPGGRLVYSTCSLEREENEGVVEEAQVVAKRTWRRIPGLDPGDGFFAAVITSE
jgi:16S rRNA (cytosine967-C5)-methyltransferase